MPHTVTTAAQEARQLRAQAKEVDREIEEAHDKVRMAESLQWQLAGHALRNRSGYGRTAAILTFVQAVKKRARKEIRHMERDKRNLERQADEVEREAEKEKERERQEKARKRNRSRSRDRDNDHDREIF